jgi:hypothetical protein
MTWTAHLTVQDVSDGPAPIDVLAAANADDTITQTLSDGTEHTYLAVVSNTEGKISGVEVRLRLDEDTTAIKPGDRIYVSGHFQGIQS